MNVMEIKRKKLLDTIGAIVDAYHNEELEHRKFERTEAVVLRLVEKEVKLYLYSKEY